MSFKSLARDAKKAILPHAEDEIDERTRDVGREAVDGLPIASPFGLFLLEFFIRRLFRVREELAVLGHLHERLLYFLALIVEFSEEGSRIALEARVVL